MELAATLTTETNKESGSVKFYFAEVKDAENKYCLYEGEKARFCVISHRLASNCVTTPHKNGTHVVCTSVMAAHCRPRESPAALDHHKTLPHFSECFLDGIAKFWTFDSMATLNPL